MDIEGSLSRVGHNEDLYKNLLIQFSSHHSDHLENIETAIQKQELGKAFELLHSLKGVAGNIGAKDLADKAAQMEKKLKSNDLGSEYESILNSAKQSMDLLITGIERLEQEYSAENVIEVSQPLPEYEDLAPYIEELKRLIEDNNLKALDYLETIEKTFNETPIKDFIDPVKGHLNRFNFTQAAKSLEEVTNDLKTSSEVTGNV